MVGGSGSSDYADGANHLHDDVASPHLISSHTGVLHSKISSQFNLTTFTHFNTFNNKNNNILLTFSEKSFIFALLPAPQSSIPVFYYYVFFLYFISYPYAVHRSTKPY